MHYYVFFIILIMSTFIHAALVEAEQRGVAKGRSLADTQTHRPLVPKKKPKITHGLPNWGQDLPEDVS